MIPLLLDGVRQGFYVDLGAHHPIRISNTFKLYANGWTGINIDASLQAIEKLDKYRPRDVNVLAAISDVKEEIEFFEYQGVSSAISTVNPSLAAKNHPNLVPQRVTRVETVTLQSVLDRFLPPGQRVDLLSIDIEGNDLKALRSLDFDKYRPELIVIEAHDFDPANPSDSTLFQFLTKNGYTYVGFLVMNAFFRRSN